jgi:hypothetical protein
MAKATAPRRSSKPRDGPVTAVWDGRAGEWLVEDPYGCPAGDDGEELRCTLYRDLSDAVALTGNPDAVAVERRDLNGPKQNPPKRSNRSRGEGDKVIAAPRLLPRLASAVESLAGDAKPFVS